jgi:hypothetical protein
MKYTITLIIFLLLYLYTIAQNDPANQDNKDNINAFSGYTLLKYFLRSEKNNPGIFSSRITPKWNSRLYKEQYRQLLSINKKKEFYPELIYDSRYISHAIPTRYSSQNYLWVSTRPKYENLGAEIASDVLSNVVSGFLSSKKHRYSFNNKGYYTPAGLKY